MSAVTTLPWGRPLTRDDLESLPDDGHRYELLDGALLVTPAPTPRHQRAVMGLIAVLTAHVVPPLEVMVAPLDVVLDESTVLQPDVLVAPRGDFSDRDLPRPPVLAVEVLSPSTRRIDLVLKRDRYRAAGCPHYWVVDPEEPGIRAWRLDGEIYVETGNAVGDALLELSQPFPVSIRPTDLVR
jgi:Uma2 family endonuclease